MGKKIKLNRKKPRSGEIISITSTFGMPPSGVYKVDGFNGPLMMLSAGTITAGVSLDFIKITGRNLRAPASWDAREIEILESTACKCEDCRKLLAAKRASAKGDIILQ